MELSDGQAVGEVNNRAPGTDIERAQAADKANAGPVEIVAPAAVEQPAQQAP